MDVLRAGGRPAGLMGSEGFAGAVAFANTRLVAGAEPPELDRSYTGINAVFVPFEVLLTDRHGVLRRQPIVALVGLDNLYGDHNPAGMVIADYSDQYLWQFRPPSPPVKTEPESDPETGSPSGAGRRRDIRWNQPGV
jgi:hypothetical protein